jgi:Dyp-type peroxidase family
MMHRRRTASRGLDLADIQGNILRPYGRFGFPFTRHMFFNIGNAADGRCFIERLRGQVTTAERWRGVDDPPHSNAPERPVVTMNIGFTFHGLLALGLPTRTLAGFPEEFIDGMAARGEILGDTGVSAPACWDDIWRTALALPGKRVHVWVSLSAQGNSDGTPVAELTRTTDWVKTAMPAGVTLLSGHKGPNPEYQDSAAIMAPLPDGTCTPTASEHFGFTDGIGDPVFAGQYEPAEMTVNVIGSGKLLPGAQGWAPLATGEFILGHASEAQELPPAPQPWLFTRNGTFMAYRKLHENVGAFKTYIAAQAAGLPNMSSPEAGAETLMAKMVGRWTSGLPLAVAPSFDEAQKLAAQWADIPEILRLASSARTQTQKARLVAYEALITNFTYTGDSEGGKCPVGAHIRRANPRDALDPLFGTSTTTPGSALTNRRRILRRGMPYGTTAADDESEHGVIFMALCGSLFRQFEFIQQQWIQYGSSFGLGNDTDPLVGRQAASAKFVIPADLSKPGVPHFCANLPQFVETRGGEYFFLPSLTALREIAEGSVDPT